MTNPSHSVTKVTIGKLRGRNKSEETLAHVKSSMDVALEVLGGKWKLTIVALLTKSSRRTGELRRLIPGINQRMLITQLRDLQHDGIIERRSYNEIPPRVTYRLTHYGKTVVPIIVRLSDWGMHHVRRTYPAHGIAYQVRRLDCVPTGRTRGKRHKRIHT